MKHLVVIGLVIPESQSTAAGFRIMQIIDLFKKQNYKISFLSSASKSEFSEKINHISIKLNDESFGDLIKTLNPDVVLFDRFVTEEQFGWRVAEVCPKALRILDTEDLHFLRAARRKAFHEQRNLEDGDFINDIFKREIASILRSDLSIIISKFELQLLKNHFKIDSNLLFYLPFLIDELNEDCPKFHERKSFMTIGNFLHEPNWQSVLQLKKLWPELKKKLPDSDLHIYGAYPSEKVFQLHNEKEGFIIKGRVISSEEVFKNYRILLAPIPYGAGLKGKIFESMKFGLPNVCSSIAAEGFSDTEQWNGFTEDLPEKFIQKATELYQDEEKWTNAQNNGFEILKNNFRNDLFESKLFIKINHILNNLKNHRNKNFIGLVLQHHSHQSTKFMSRWIEEKNKLQS